MQIEQYRGFKAELAIAETFDEIKLIESKAAAAAEFAKKNKIGLDEQNEWGKFRVEIESKKGEWLDKMFPKGGDKGNQYTGGKVALTDLAKEGISKDESSNARLVYKEPEIRDRIINELIEKGQVITPSAVSSGIRNEKRKADNKKIFENNELPEGKYNVIYADPPWPVGSIVMDKWESPIDEKYPTMTLNEIKLLPIKELSAENCALFIWTTHTFLPDCFDIIKDWGFKYFCTITWNKHNGWTQFGFHKMTEFLLYAYKGKMNINQFGSAFPTLIDEKKGKHSKKPDSIRDLIKSKTPDGRIELFAREKYNGWESWGNEL